MNLETSHRRIHWKGKLIRWTLIPMALLAGFAWLYVSYGACMEEGDEFGSVCHASRVIPFLPTLGALAIAVFIAWDLFKLGRAAHFEKHGKKATRHPRHIKAGYDAISDEHKRHVRWTIAMIVGVTAAVIGWIAWQAYQSTH